MKLGAVVLIGAALLQCGDATFNADNVGDPNAFDLTRILDCAADADSGGRLTVNLVQPRDDTSFWLPAAARYKITNKLGSSLHSG